MREEDHSEAMGLANIKNESDIQKILEKIEKEIRIRFTNV
jgi:hypothetical protein